MRAASSGRVSARCKADESRAGRCGRSRPSRDALRDVGHTTHFKGWTEEESRPLLAYLFAHQVQPELTCRFHWEPGSLALWDNRCTQHFPVNDYHGFRRVMHRVTLAGDTPM